MKKFFLLIAVIFLSLNSVQAQDFENAAPSICEVSKSCGKACRMKEANENADNDPAYRQLLVKCAEDVAKELKLN